MCWDLGLTLSFLAWRLRLVDFALSYSNEKRVYHHHSNQAMSCVSQSTVGNFQSVFCTLNKTGKFFWNVVYENSFFKTMVKFGRSVEKSL